MAAAVALGERGFLGVAHHADDPRTERARPLAEQQPDAARGGMHEDPIVAADFVCAPQQVMRGEPLEHERRRLLVADAARHLDETLRGDVAQIGITAGLSEHVGDTVTHPEAAHATTDRRDRARGLAAETTGQRHGVEPDAVVDVDVIEADGGMAHQHLTGRRQTRIEILEDQRLGTAGLV